MTLIAAERSRRRDRRDRRPAADIRHALACFEHGKHVVMVNVEADASPVRCSRSGRAQAGVVYSPRLRRPAGAHLRAGRLGACQRLRVVAAGKGTKYLPGVPRLDAGHGVGSLRVHAGAGGCRRLQRTHVQLVPRRHQVGDRDGRGAQRDRPHARTGRARVPAVRRRTICRACCAARRRGRSCTTPGRWRWSRASSATARRCSATCAGACTSRSPPAADYVRRCFRTTGSHRRSGDYAALYQPYHLIGLELGSASRPRACGASRPGCATDSAATWSPSRSATSRPGRRSTAKAASPCRAGSSPPRRRSPRARCRSASRTA